MDNQRSRTFTLDRKANSGNLFPAVAATETPVLRGDFYEVLDMSRVDLSRAPLPLIESHDQSKVNIGVFQETRVDGDKLRGVIRLGSSARAAELAEDIRGEIVRNVSVGYQTSDPIEAGEMKGLPVYRFAWAPLELSLVAAPADVNSGIYRGRNTMETEETRTGEQRREPIQKDEAERKRVADIRAMAEKLDKSTLGLQAITEGWSVADFHGKALREVDRENAQARRKAESSANYAGVPADDSRYGRAMNEYSITNVIRSLADPAKAPRNSLELEISEDIKREQRQETSSSIIVPWQVLQETRAVTASGTNSSTIAVDHLAGSFIDVLRNKSLVMGLGPTMLTGLVGDVDIPRQTGTTTAYWIAGDNADSITESDPTFDQVTLSPKFVGGATTFSRKMLVQSAPGIETIIRGDLANMIGVEIDANAIAGPGSSNKPLGVINQTGVNVLDFAGSTPTFAEVVEMEELIADDNGIGTGMVYLTTPTIHAAMKTTPRQASGVEGNFILEAGRVNDYRCLATKNVPASYMILGDWSQMIVGMWGGIELDADPYGSNFLKGSVTVRVIAQMDIAVRHPVAFCIGSENIS